MVGTDQQLKGLYNCALTEHGATSAMGAVPQLGRGADGGPCMATPGNHLDPNCLFGFP